MLAFMTIPAFVVNAITADDKIATNYMFLAKSQAPLTVFERLFGSHLWGFPIIILAILVVMYVPVETYRYVAQKRK